MLKHLASDGHSIGLHGLGHLNADEAVAERGAERYFAEEVWPQMDQARKNYVPFESFAYPNCRRNDETDALFREICACLRRAAERKEVLSVTSHNIAPDATHIHMKTEWLEKILDTASECGLAVIGFNELPHASA